MREFLKKILEKKEMGKIYRILFMRGYDYMNSNLNEETIIQIRQAVDIVDVISNYIPLTAKGKNFFGVCPFHADHSPSMSVSKEKQIYKCFSCGATGTVFQFIMNYENVGFIEAAKMLADRAGIPLSISGAKKNIDNNNELYEMYEISQKFYQNNINSEYGLAAKNYLKDRGINKEIIKEFEIGLALKDNGVLANMLINKKYPIPLILESGLVIDGDRGLHDIYHNRIMFPLYDLSGRIVGYSGRIYQTKEGSKYVNTRETKIFKKGELLYNYHRAKEEARQAKQIIIVEGFMDVIGLYKVGIKNVVATMGTAVTKEQALLMKRLAPNIILCFDGDAAGAHATFACIDELNKIGIIPKVVRLEDNLDPDEYVTKFGDKIKAKLDNPVSIIDFKLQYLKNGKNLDDNVEYSNYIKTALKEINQLDDPILIELSLQKISKETNIDIGLLKDQLEENKDTKKIITPIKKVNTKKNKYQLAEQYLIYYMLNDKEVATIFDHHRIFLPTDKYRILAREVVAIYKENSRITLADIMTILKDDKNYIDTINELISLNLKEEYTKEEILDYINMIALYNIKQEKNHLKDMIKMEIEPKKKAEYAYRVQELKQKEQEIMKEGI